MKFLTDQDVFEVTVRHLRTLGHNVLPARKAGLSLAPDRDLLRWAHNARRVLVTRDKGFGQLVFLSGEPSAGVVLLRLEPATLKAVHQELERFLREHAGENLSGHFIIIEPGRHRIRRPGR
jgi:predicted nuclease of predicted toxin-antitoxin system